MRRLEIPEGSDTQFTFHITETEDWQTTDLDLTNFDKIVLSIKYVNSISEVEWTIKDNTTSYVIFDILSEATIWKVGWVNFDIWGVKWTTKIRFNSETMEWQILPSIKIPQWVANE